MSKTIPIQDWLQNIDDEYLSAFVREGGASIKFAVTPDGLKPDLYEAVNTRCQKLDYIFARLDAAEIRAHMPQDLFFGLAHQVDWRFLARRLILRLASGRGYAVEGVNPRASGNLFAAVADANEIELQFFPRGDQAGNTESRLQEPADGQGFPSGDVATLPHGGHP